jgi:hypothetical protein
MTEEVKEKRGYRKVKETLISTIGSGSLTLDEIVTATGFTKWYTKVTLEKLVKKGLILEADGKFSGFTVRVRFKHLKGGGHYYEEDTCSTCKEGCIKEGCIKE